VKLLLDIKENAKISMNQVDKASPAASSDLMSNQDTTRIQQPWLTLARVVWIVIVVPTLALYVANIPAYFAALHRLRYPGQHLFTGQLRPVDILNLHSWGLSLDFYATCLVLASLLFQFSYAAVGVLLFWRRSNDRVALFVSFALMLIPFGYSYLTLQALPPAWAWLIPTLSVLGNVSIMICAYLFPDGRFVPPWILWLAVALIGYWVVSAILLSRSLSPFWLDLILFGLIASTILVQIYRYRDVSTPQQRQQTKWAVYGISIAAFGNLGTRLLFALVVFPLSHGSLLAYALEVLLVTCSMLVIPPTVGIAILRSHLWDIDVLINRTLVYGTLTLILTAVYVGLVIGLQALLRDVIKQDSSLAIVISTLAIAALFQPLRHSLQQFIDRRFYRSKYDAAEIIAAFSARLQSEVDLSQLREQLLAVVQEATQPTFVSLWVRSSEHVGTGGALQDGHSS
jgi:hypothetical protein